MRQTGPAFFLFAFLENSFLTLGSKREKHGKLRIIYPVINIFNINCRVHNGCNCTIEPKKQQEIYLT